ncbi:MAG: L,D-transpeptidase family protein [Lachnospiraceae bacterium]|nr:L,D-transpeptidase family protein [Lachnospiraceae bacterium]
MNKKIVVSLIAALAFTLSACSKAPDSNAAVTGSDAKDANASDEMYASNEEIKDPEEWLLNLEAAKDSNNKQLFVVAAMGTDTTTATIFMLERDAKGTWKQILSTPGFVGKNGLCPDGDHKEGCGQTPIGTYKFNKAFGIADDPGCAIPYVKVTDDTYWSGDTREGMHYNEMVDIKDYPDLEMEDSEHIVDYVYQYQYCLNISFNEDGTPGRGSAIFLHCFGPEKPYTGGCVAVPEYVMKTIMRKVDPDCTVVIDTMDSLKK